MRGTFAQMLFCHINCVTLVSVTTLGDFVPYLIQQVLNCDKVFSIVKTTCYF